MVSPPNREEGSSGRTGQPGGGAVPATIGRYKVRRLIGHGAQGNVYLAYDPNLEIDFAIKVLHPDYRAEEFIDRLKMEARTLFRLTALNVVRVYEFDPEYPYLVMEYCGDGDLNQYIKTRKRRPLSEILSITRQICEALVAAHENEPCILHRDLKPGNVLFQKNVPKVADFGLAKMLGTGGSGLTTTRGVMGTVRYCSPEQLRDASRVDHRADLWSVGVILYELLTWVRPFDKADDSFVNIALRVHTEPPREAPYEIPAPLMAVINRALEKTPARRYGSAREMINGLDEARRAIPGADRLLLPPEQLVDEQSRLAAQVADLLDRGRADEAGSLTTKIGKLAPDDSLYRFWQKRLREIRHEDHATPSDREIDTEQRKRAEWLEKQFTSIQSFIQSRAFREARRLIGEILVQDPDNTIAQRWLDRVNEEEKGLREDLDRAHQDADRLRRAGDYRGVHAVWKKLAEKHPGLQEIQAEMAVAARELEVQERKRLRDAADAEAGRFMDAGDLHGAAAAWQTYLATSPADQQAAQALQAVQKEIRSREQARRLAEVAARAAELTRAGDLEAALAIWETHLQADPASTDAARRIEELRAEIAARDRARSLQETRARAGSCLEAGDFAGAVRAWERLLADDPHLEEARRQVAALRKQAAEEEHRALAHEVQDLARSVEARAQAGRYQGLPGIQKSIGAAVASARAATSKDVEALRVARKTLAAAQQGAERALARELTSRRVRLLERVRETRGWLPGLHGARGFAALTPAEQALERSLAGGLAALCESTSADTPGDPLEGLQRAEADLAEATSALTAERGQGVREAGALASRALQEARAALDECHGAAAAGAGAGGDLDPSPLRERLATLQAQLQIPDPKRLAAVAGQASELKREAGAIRAAAAGRLAARLSGLLQAARVLSGANPSPRLEDLSSRAALAIEAMGGEGRPAAGDLEDLCGEMEREIAAAREELERRESAACQRWQDALRAWRVLRAADFKGAGVEEGEKIVAHGEAALALRRAEEVEGWAVQLGGLARRLTLESAWIDQSEMVLQLEGALGQDGLPVREVEAPEDDELLGAYRRAMARGDGAGARALAPRLKERAARRAGGGEAGPEGAPALPPDLSTAARRLNKRYNKAALDSFDQLAARHRTCLSQGRKGEAAQIAAKLQAAHRRLLRPAPLWRRAVVPAAAVLLVAAAVTYWSGVAPGAERRYPVTVVSAVGAIEVQSVRCAGKAVEIQNSRVPETGARWELPEGHCAIAAGNGAPVEIDVPAQTVIVLPGDGGDYSEALLDALEVGRLLEIP